MKKRPQRPIQTAPNPTRNVKLRTSAAAQGGKDNVALCPVVGVGASAGGLEAFTELLKHLPQNTGLAFALVQHLDPARESHLSEILSRSTAMPVVEAKDGILLEPDRIYVIPPNASMSVRDGALEIALREEGHGRHLPIDHFFQSLAAGRGNKAIGVVLSGNGSDGTLGLKAIKAAGGIAFAQAEASAKFPGMPRSAINAGFVDFILPPENIAAELTRLGTEPYVIANHDEEIEAPHPGGGLKQIFKLLRTATGVDFTNYRQTTIQRRIQRRVTVQRVETVDEYVKLLEKNPAEVQALFQDILIHVTNFFREPESFAALTTQVFPELLKHRRPGESLRIWLPGCSTGEEAYSLAISLAEFLGEKMKHGEVQLFATDVSDTVIETARKGVFDAGIEADVSPERLRRFFTKVEGGYQINKAIRELCIFARQNVIQDPPFSKLDLISFRNVMIYFEPALQKKLIPVFHYVLKPHGYLLLGSAESVGRFDDLFLATDPKNKIFLKRATGSRTRPHVHLGDDFLTTQCDPQESGAHARQEVWSRLDVHKEADRLLMAKFCPPAIVIDDAMEIIQFRGEVAPYLNPASGEASLNLFKMMHPAVAMELRTAILAARTSNPPGRKYTVKNAMPAQSREVTLEVMRIDPPAVKERCFIVLFEEVPPLEKAVAMKRNRSRDAQAVRFDEELSAAKEQVQALMEEHEATNEELRSANEEIQSSNEELQSTNEELETSQEELQSTNEELTTLNEELQHNNEDLKDVNDDLNNLLRTVNLPVVMLSRDLLIRRFTPAAQKLYKLISTDIGRAVTDIQTDIDVPDLSTLVREVIDTLVVKELELRDRHGRWHRLQVRPYETADNKIAGAVLIFFDIDAAKRNGERLQHAISYADAIVETVREPLLVLDGDLRVKRATSAFCTQFRVDANATEGRLFYELGDNQWNIPALRSLLEEVLPDKKRVDDFKVEHVFPKIGRKTMELNARRVETAGDGEALIVLSITEVRP